MGFGNLAHDREPEAAAGTVARRAAALEALQYPFAFALGNTWTIVFYSQYRVRVLEHDTNRCFGALRV